MTEQRKRKGLSPSDHMPFAGHYVEAIGLMFYGADFVPVWWAYRRLWAGPRCPRMCRSNRQPKFEMVEDCQDDWHRVADLYLVTRGRGDRIECRTRSAAAARHEALAAVMLDFADPIRPRLRLMGGGKTRLDTS